MTSAALGSLAWSSRVSALRGPAVPRCVPCPQRSVPPALPLLLKEVKRDLSARPEPELSALRNPLARGEVSN